MNSVFARKPGREAAIFAEAQALLDDGLDSRFVLDLYEGERAWLAPLLRTTDALETAAGAEEPSYYFEASLKQKFLAASDAKRQRVHGPAPVAALAPAAPSGRFRTFATSSAIMAGAGLAGFIAIGFITADDSVRGDWNYTFKLTHERIDYALSRGNGRIDVQLRSTEARVQEIIQLSNRGELQADDVDNLRREAEDLARLAQTQPLDDLQKAKLESIGKASVAILTDVQTKQTELQPAIETTIVRIADAVAAGLSGGVRPLPPTATATPSPATSSETATAEPASPSATVSTTPTPTATATPDETRTAAATAPPARSPEATTATPRPEAPVTSTPAP